MREQVAQVRPDLLRKVTATIGDNPFPRVSDGTIFAQPAIFCASLRENLAPAEQAAKELGLKAMPHETMLALRDRCVEKFIEVGSGKVLPGLAKRTLHDVELVHA